MSRHIFEELARADRGRSRDEWHARATCEGFDAFRDHLDHMVTQTASATRKCDGQGATPSWQVGQATNQQAACPVRLRNYRFISLCIDLSLAKSML
jgi:hypothetical protein